MLLVASVQLFVPALIVAVLAHRMLFPVAFCQDIVPTLVVFVVDPRTMLPVATAAVILPILLMMAGSIGTVSVVTALGLVVPSLIALAVAPGMPQAMSTDIVGQIVPSVLSFVHPSATPYVMVILLAAAWLVTPILPGLVLRGIAVPLSVGASIVPLLLVLPLIAVGIVLPSLLLSSLVAPPPGLSPRTCGLRASALVAQLLLLFRIALQPTLCIARVASPPLLAGALVATCGRACSSGLRVLPSECLLIPDLDVTAAACPPGRRVRGEELCCERVELRAARIKFVPRRPPGRAAGIPSGCIPRGVDARLLLPPNHPPHHLSYRSF